MQTLISDFRGTLKRTRPFQITNKTSDHASTAPAQLPSNMRARALRKRKMKTTNWTMMTIPSLTGICVSVVPVYTEPSGSLYLQTVLFAPVVFSLAEKLF